MKLGIILYSNEPETVWNAFRLAEFSLDKQDQVKVFLLAKGVECESLDSTAFNIPEQMQHYVDKGGEILACGTCIKIRQQNESAMCPLSTMEDLYQLIADSDRVVSL